MRAGCAAPQGAHWATADFDKRGEYYAAFPTERLRIGMTLAEVQALFGNKLRLGAQGPDYRVFYVKQWESQPGEDEVNGILALNFVGDAS
jgi:hypothetical protein